MAGVNQALVAKIVAKIFAKIWIAKYKLLIQHILLTQIQLNIVFRYYMTH